jgi:hypothetical protein
MTVWVWGGASVVVVVAPDIVVVEVARGRVVVVARGRVVVVARGPVVVVVTAAQLPAAQVSQQLGTVLTQTEPPLGAVHLAALGFTTHFVLPLAVVRQQVTNPALPQVDFLAHPNTAARHVFGRLPLSAAALATWATQ